MPNERYQPSSASGPQRCASVSSRGAARGGHLRGYADADLATLVTDLGGHDIDAMLAAYAECDAVTPPVGGLRLHRQGDGACRIVPRNHWRC